MPDRNSLSTNDALATMNDHLARFFQHADGLLKEWQTYSETLRVSLDRQASDLHRTVTSAVQGAGREAAQAMSAGLDSSLAESLAGLRRELDALTRTASQAQAQIRGQAAGGTSAVARSLGGSAGWPPIAWAAMLSANVMLIALLVLTTRSCVKAGDLQAGAGSGQGTSMAARPAADAGVPGAGCEDLVASVRARDSAAAPCAALAQGYEFELAKAFVTAAAAGLCEEAHAAPVTESLLWHLSELPRPRGTPEGNESDNKPQDDKSGSKPPSDRKRSSRSGSSSSSTSGTSGTSGKPRSEGGSAAGDGKSGDSAGDKDGK